MNTSIPVPDSGRMQRRPGIQGASALSQAVRDMNWAATPLGPIESWSNSLLTSVNMILAAPIPMQLLWGEQHICIYNDAMAVSLSGKHPGSLGQPGREVWREAWHLVGPQIDEVMRFGATFNHADVFIPLMRDGKLVDQYWSYSYSPVFEADGTIGGVLDVAQETTGKVVALKEATLERARMDAIIASVPVGVLVADEKGRILFGNAELDKIVRHPLLVSDSTEAYAARYAVHADGTPFAADEYPMARAIDKGETVRREEILYMRGDGTPGWISVSAAPVRDMEGRVLGGVVAVSDISVEREIRHNMARSVARFRLLIERAGIGINIGDTEGNLSYINPALLKLIGYTEEEVTQGVVRWSDLTPPECADADRKALRELMETGVATPYEKIYIAKDGTRIPVLLHAATIPGATDDRARNEVAVFFTDLTQQKKSEAVLLQNEKLAAVGRLAATIAHEINNPLEAVTNLLYLARQHASDDQARQWLDLADAELRRVSAIASQTLRFHRQASNAQLTTCAALFSSTLNLYEARLRNSGIQVERRKRAKRPVVCFEGDMRQVLSNLVTNAIDAMSQSGRLLVRSREGTDWRSGRKGLVLTVADTGPGIPEDVRERIFEPFFTTKGMNGSGLGLWICSQIMERHEGVMLLRSSRKPAAHGTVISLFLPFEAAV